MDPFQILLDIERDCKANAVEIPRQIVTRRDWLGVGFRSSNFNFVCPMQEVSEILSRTMLTEIPSAQAWFKGTANLRGHILPVTDLQAFVTGKPHPKSPLNRILITTFENALFGFSVEQVFGIEHFFSEEMKPLEGRPETKAYWPYAKSAFEKEGQPWIIIHLSSIVENPSFYHILTTKIEAS